MSHAHIETADIPDLSDLLVDEVLLSEPSGNRAVAPSAAATPTPARIVQPALDSLDRRRAPRRLAAEFGQDLRISLPGAAEARPVDISATGVLTETTHRLCPGRTVDLFLRLNGVRRVLRARVVRSSVHALSPRPLFRAALQFEDPGRLPECDQ
jgi:hypothetical protein